MYCRNLPCISSCQSFRWVSDSRLWNQVSFFKFVFNYVYMVQVCTSLTEDPSLVPRTHIGKLTTTCISSSKESNILFWPSLTNSHINTYSFQIVHMCITVWVCACECWYSQGSEEGIGSPGAGLKVMRCQSQMLDHWMSGEKQTWVLWKASVCSEPAVFYHLLLGCPAHWPALQVEMHWLPKAYKSWANSPCLFLLLCIHGETERDGGRDYY